MNINRHNYESFFILYMDNELDAAGRQEVEKFIALHPDLKEELELLQQFKLSPDTIEFTDKASLYRTESVLQEQLLLYTDHELDAAGMRQLEKQAAENPAIQKEMDLFRAATLEAEQIVFPYKESLYRTETKVRPIAYKWWRAAAAVLLLAGGLSALVLSNRKSIDNGLAGTNGQGGQKTVQPKQQPDRADYTPEETAPVTAGTNNTSVPVPSQANRIPVQQQQQPVQQVKQVLPVNNTIQIPDQGLAQQDIRRDNNLPKPDQNPNVVNLKTNEAVIANNNKVPDVKMPDNKSLANQVVTNQNTQPSDITAVSYNPDQEEKGKKSKLRGLLRKVTRTFEKRTNIDPTDDEDRLLVGGLAIKLK